MTTTIEHSHLLVMAPFLVTGWFLVVYLWPRAVLQLYKRAILGKGIGEGPIPINTLGTQPQRLFADPLGMAGSASPLATRGVNRDTLVTAGWLDLRNGPLVLHVPDMAGRYYSVQLTDPRTNAVIAYIGKRATGTAAGDFLLTGPTSGQEAPQGMPRIASPSDAVLVLGRVFVASEGDLPTAHALAKQIQVAPPMVGRLSS